MGTTKMDEPETSGNKTSQIQEKTRKTSVESSIAPKAAQPSCLRGAFICLFLKRAEQDNWGEEPSRKNHSTEDKEDVKGKKRRVVRASVFRLPCLRPAERTGSDEQINNLQEKVMEQNNQIIAIEELKPYSKASFLRKIRGYRLMRERDATDKEKVVEIGQSFHATESMMGMEHLEQNNKSKQGEKVIEHSHEDEKGNVLAGEECRTDRFGELGKNLIEQVGQAEFAKVIDNNLRNQDISPEKIKEQVKDVIEQESQIVDSKNKGPVKQNGHEEKVEKLGNDLQNLESPLGGAEVMEKDFQVQDGCAEKLEDLGSQLLEHANQAEEVQEQGKNSPTLKTPANRVSQPDKDFAPQRSPSEEVGKVRGDFPEEESPSVRVRILPEQVINAEEVRKFLPKQESHSEEVGNKLQQQKKHPGEVGMVEDDLPKKDSEAEKVEHYLVEQESHTEEVEKLGDKLTQQESETEKVEHHLVEQESHTEEVEKLGDKLTQQESETEKVEHYLVEQESDIEEVEKLAYNLSEQKSETGKDGHNLVEQECHTEEVEKLGDKLTQQERETEKVVYHLVVQELETLGDNFPVQENKKDQVGLPLVEQENHREDVERLGDNLPEQESETGKHGDYLVEQEGHAEEIRNSLVENNSPREEVGKNLVEQESNVENRVRNNYTDHDIHVVMVEEVKKDLLQYEGGEEIDQEMQNDLFEKDSHAEELERVCQFESQAYKVGEQWNVPLEQGSYTEKKEEQISDLLEQDAREPGKDTVAKENQAQVVGESRKNTTDFPQTSSMAEDRQHVPPSNLSQEGTLRNSYEELETSEVSQEDLLTSRTCDSKETRALDTSVRKKTLVTQTRNNTTFQEPHTQSGEFKEEKMTSSSYKADPINKEPEPNLKAVYNEEDAMGCKDTDWGTLRVEVKDMVQWLVQEASDRLTNYTEESHGTG